MGVLLEACWPAEPVRRGGPKAFADGGSQRPARRPREAPRHLVVVKFWRPSSQRKPGCQCGQRLSFFAPGGPNSPPSYGYVGGDGDGCFLFSPGHVSISASWWSWSQRRLKPQSRYRLLVLLLPLTLVLAAFWKVAGRDGDGPKWPNAQHPSNSSGQRTECCCSGLWFLHLPAGKDSSTRRRATWQMSLSLCRRPTLDGWPVHASCEKPKGGKCVCVRL